MRRLSSGKRWIASAEFNRSFIGSDYWSWKAFRCQVYAFPVLASTDSAAGLSLIHDTDTNIPKVLCLGHWVVQHGSPPNFGSMLKPRSLNFPCFLGLEQLGRGPELLGCNSK